MKNKIHTVVSLFDGISCAMVALEKAGHEVVEYYASEVDKYAVAVSKKNHPDIIQVGDVKKLSYENGVLMNTDAIDNPEENSWHIEGGVDLLIGGSPCQDLSVAKTNRKGLKGERSGLFYEYLRILREVKPKYFVLENVASMPKEAKDEITRELGVEPIMIDAALVSAQRRKRLFWTNIPNVKLPEDRGILLRDVLEDGIEPEKEKSNTIRTGGRGSGHGDKHNWDEIKGKSLPQSQRVYPTDGKSVTLQANGGGAGAKTGLYMVQRGRGKNAGNEHHEKSPTVTSSSFEHNHTVEDGDTIVRKLTPVECERLQSLPDGYTEGVSNAQRYKTLGNAFNVEVVAHILRHIP